MRMSPRAAFSTLGRGCGAVSLALAVSVCAADSPNTGDAEVSELAAEVAPRAAALILEPVDGAQLTIGEVRVRLGAEHIAIMPAGDTTPNTGHHHLLLNVPVPAEGEAIPADQAGYVHLGQAQTEYTFEGLAPGQYTLIAVIGDLVHRVLPQATDTVRFTVVAPE